MHETVFRDAEGQCLLVVWIGRQLPGLDLADYNILSVLGNTILHQHKYPELRYRMLGSEQGSAKANFWMYILHCIVLDPAFSVALSVEPVPCHKQSRITEDH